MRSNARFYLPWSTVLNVSGTTESSRLSTSQARYFQQLAGGCRLYRLNTANARGSRRSLTEPGRGSANDKTIE